MPEFKRQIPAELYRKILDVIWKAKSLAILPHTNPDADALGSSFAFLRMLRTANKEAMVYTDDAAPAYLSFLCEDYMIYDDAGRVKRVTYGEPEPVEEPVIGPVDVCICLDCGDIDRIGARRAIMDSASVTINIDHHVSNTYFCDINYVWGGLSSTGEVICPFMECLAGDEDEPLDPRTATMLYAAIAGDTGGFRFSNTTSVTMRLAARLIGMGADAVKVSKEIFDTDPIEIIRLKGLLAQRIELFENGAVALTRLYNKDCEQFGLRVDDVDNIVDIARRVKGVEVAISMKESARGIKVSMRSEGRVDVAQIAKMLGGGGHVRAAGVTVDADMDSLLALIVEQVRRQLSMETVRIN